MDQYPIAASSLEKYYHINGKQFERQYKEHLSGYTDWEEKDHADKWLIFPKNIGPRMSIDETSMSNGEVYTILSNKDAHCRNGAIAAIVYGTKVDDVYNALKLIPEEIRLRVEEVTLDLSSSMRLICSLSFPQAVKVIDRFHVQKLALEALQDIRIRHRWDAIDADNESRMMAKATGKDYIPDTYHNGDTRKQLLARSRHLLFKSPEKWSKSQKTRAAILFEEYPDIKEAYSLVHRLRMIYAHTKTKGGALPKLALWYNDVQKTNFKEFKTVAETIQTHYSNILNFFNNRSTNASAESLNSKIKAFRMQLRGVSDVKYFLFRLAKIYA